GVFLDPTGDAIGVSSVMARDCAFQLQPEAALNGQMQPLLDKTA
ncbi:MAG: hypothetical protein QOG73_3610, partial [Acetobacteraceae bacterium]|nr:hypothetical protein [Acetobacteraceae bacterium]